MEKIQEQLIEILKELLDNDEEINKDLGFFDMGLSSLTVYTFAEKINERFTVECDEADIFNYPNVNELSEYIRCKLLNR